MANTCWYLYNFRLPLILELQSLGYNVSLVAPLDSYATQLQEKGLIVHDWQVSRRSLNPLRELISILDLLLIYRREKPDLVHHFTIKACLYGTLAAKGARIYTVINAMTGLGHVFLGTRKRSRLFRKLIKPLYRATFMARRSTVVFQNASDQEKLIQLGLTDVNKARLIRGSGVDINHFSPPFDNAGHFGNPLTLLFPSRLICEKGTIELLEACRYLWDQGYVFDLFVAGALDSGNRSSLSTSQLNALAGDPRIHLLGHVGNMRKLYSTADIVILPSWREGLSRSLIEAASMERPIITTDVPGCRDVIDHGISGLLVPLRDPQAIQLAIQLLIANPTLARNLGKAARKKVVAEFQVSTINENTLVQYKTLLEKPLGRKPLFDGLF